MFCPKCGKQLPENASFCSGCGAKLAQKAAPAVSASPTPAAASGAAALKIPFDFKAPQAFKAPEAFKVPTSIDVASLGTNNILAMAGTLLSTVACFLPWVSLGADTVGLANKMGGWLGISSGSALKASYSLIDFVDFGNAMAAYGSGDWKTLAIFLLVLTIAAIALGVVSVVRTLTGKAGTINRISAIAFVAMSLISLVLFMRVDGMAVQILPVILMGAGAAMAFIFPQKAA